MQFCPLTAFLQGAEEEGHVFTFSQPLYQFSDFELLMLRFSYQSLGLIFLF